MNRKSLVSALVAVFTTSFTSHAVDTTRYALIAAPQVKEVPRLPVLESPATSLARWWLRPADLPVQVAPGVTPEDKNLIGWTPMSIEVLGYDIRKVWRMEEEVWTFGGLGFSR